MTPVVRAGGRSIQGLACFALPLCGVEGVTVMNVSSNGTFYTALN